MLARFPWPFGCTLASLAATFCKRSVGQPADAEQVEIQGMQYPKPCQYGATTVVNEILPGAPGARGRFLTKRIADLEFFVLGCREQSGVPLQVDTHFTRGRLKISGDGFCMCVYGVNINLLRSSEDWNRSLSAMPVFTDWLKEGTPKGFRPSFDPAVLHSWADVDVTVIAGGFAKAGTGTLREAMHSHPQLRAATAFSYDERCGVFNKLGLLPRGWPTRREAGDKLPFLHSSHLFDELLPSLQLAALAHLRPEVRLLCILRDQEDMFESFYEHQLAPWSLDSDAYSKFDHVLKFAMVGERLDQMLAFLPWEQFSILSLAAVQRSGRLAFNAALDTMGLQPFPEGWSVPHEGENPLKGKLPNSIDLCAPQHAALRSRLRRRLRPDRRLLHAILSAYAQRGPSHNSSVVLRTRSRCGSNLRVRGGLVRA